MARHVTVGCLMTRKNETIRVSGYLEAYRANAASARMTAIDGVFNGSVVKEAQREKTHRGCHIFVAIKKLVVFP